MDDPRFDHNGRDSTGLGPKARALKAEYEARFRELPSAEIVEAIRRHGGIVGEFNRHSDVLRHPQTESPGLSPHLADGRPVPRMPAAFPRPEPQPPRRPPP